MSETETERPCCAVAIRLTTEELGRLDDALRSGVPYRRVCEHIGIAALPESAVYKHRAHLLNPALLKAAAPKVLPRTEDAAGEADEEQAESDLEQAEKQVEALAISTGARSVLDESRRTRKQIRRMISDVRNGVDGIDFRAAASLIGQYRALLELEAKILGDIKAASTTINVFNSPDYKEFESMLADALIEYPDAADAVMRVIQERRALVSKADSLH